MTRKPTRSRAAPRAAQIVKVPKEHRRALLWYASELIHLRPTPPRFENAMRKYAMKEFDLSPLPRPYRVYIQAVRLELGLLTDDERLSAAEPKRKVNHLGLRPKKAKPTLAMVTVGGAPFDPGGFGGFLTTDPAQLGPHVTATFGGGGVQIFSTGKQEPPLEFADGPLPHPSPFFDRQFGEMTYEPTGLPAPQAGVKLVPPQEITPRRLGQWAGRRRQDYGGSQNWVMSNVSAGSYAKWVMSTWTVVGENLRAIEASAWEWLHLVAFSMGGIGNQPQQADNLVAGTVHANTEMMLYENAIKSIVEARGAPLWVGVSATLKAHSHLGDQISYTVTRKVPGQHDRSTTFRTNALKMDAPAHGLEKVTRDTLDRVLFG